MPDHHGFGAGRAEADAVADCPPPVALVGGGRRVGHRPGGRVAGLPAARQRRTRREVGVKGAPASHAEGEKGPPGAGLVWNQPTG